MAYVIHVCKNSKLKPDDPNYCDRAWVDEDKHNATTIPPSWKYCDECVKKGFKNPRTIKSKKNTRTDRSFQTKNG